jgi:hypothetical protein
MRTRLVLLALAAGAAWPQPLKVYSEFARLDAKGQPVAPEFPREILSPAIARNAFNSFQVVVQVPDGTPWRLYVAQNPENAVDATLYRINNDRLERVAQPATGSSTQVLWMDLWADKGAPVSRIKVEPQLFVNNDWVIYPMEVRIMAASVPDGARAAGTAPPGEVMRGFLCGARVESAAPEPGVVTAASLRFRNAQQDLALAALVPREELQERFGACDAAPPENNPEWYYRVRDFLLQSPK